MRASWAWTLASVLVRARSVLVPKLCFRTRSQAMLGNVNAREALLRPAVHGAAAFSGGARKVQLCAQVRSQAQLGNEFDEFEPRLDWRFPRQGNAARNSLRATPSRRLPSGVTSVVRFVSAFSAARSLTLVQPRRSRRCNCVRTESGLRSETDVQPQRFRTRNCVRPESGPRSFTKGRANSGIWPPFVRRARISGMRRGSLPCSRTRR